MYHLDCKWQILNSGSLRQTQMNLATLGIQESLESKTIRGYRWSWASGTARTGGSDWRLLGLLPLFLSVWKPCCFSLKPGFLHRGANQGDQQLWNSKSISIIKRDRLTDNLWIVNLLTNQPRPGGWIMWDQSSVPGSYIGIRRIERVGCKDDKKSYIFTSYMLMDWADTINNALT